ncbi:MAG: hypothetical protein KME30_29945 [Iphinoe sp. HA4291-MV1]|jgi:hypothetical protein|nr:hypothetical protein [Iphinoe sp. HA4291-MV1]
MKYLCSFQLLDKTKTRIIAAAECVVPELPKTKDLIGITNIPGQPYSSAITKVVYTMLAVDCEKPRYLKFVVTLEFVAEVPIEVAFTIVPIVK